MRLAIWTPLPPQRSGIADYAYALLAELTTRAEVVAVVRDGSEARARAPSGVAVMARSDYVARGVDLDIYYLGNYTRFHGYMYEAIRQHPGMLVLHDPALPDFHRDLCGGLDSAVFLEEARFDCPEVDSALPVRYVDGRAEIDWLRLPLSRRVVEASDLTVVHSRWARNMLAERYPNATIVNRWLAAEVSTGLTAESDVRRPLVTFGVFGGISPPKRILRVLEAFSAVHQESPDARLIIAGRPDDEGLVKSIHATIERDGLSDAVLVRLDVPTDELSRLIDCCDAIVALRWPTVGETSAPMMRAFGRARLVITSDVPQTRELDERFCWRVPVGGEEEITSLVGRMREVIADPSSAREVGRLARKFIQDEATFGIVADAYVKLAASLIDGRKGRLRTARPRARQPVAVNAIGPWPSTTGLAEAARRSVEAMLDAAVPVALETIDFGYPKDERRVPERFRRLPTGRPYPIDVCFLNVNEMNVLPPRYLRSGRSSNHVVGSWYWELPTFPPHLRGELDRVDEIWVTSRFTADAFRSATDRPVFHMPCVVEPVANPRIQRSDLGLPADRFIFLCGFDARSTLARKNPFAVVEAYRRAFSSTERTHDVVLVMKTSRLRDFPEARALLGEAMANVGGVLLDADLAPEEMGSLTAQCDAYVSLHRAEGFGLGMAEAMYFGRPVIATAYSGNTDFMSPTDSCLVGYTITRINEMELRFNPEATFIYTPGQLWAEPDVDQAARWMRVLFEDEGLRASYGHRAAMKMRELYSKSTAGAAARARLEEIDRMM